MQSKKWSFVGWQFGKWFKGNKEAIKLVTAALFGLWVPVDPAIKAIAGAVMKLVLDSIDFYASEVNLDK